MGEQVSPVRWSWLVRCVGQEVRVEPVLEEEPTEKDADGGFNDWLEYNAGTIVLTSNLPRNTAPGAKV